MIWSSTSTIERLLIRRVREELVDINAELADLQQQLQTAKNILQPIVQEVTAARGGYPTLGARLDALTPPSP